MENESTAVETAPLIRSCHEHADSLGEETAVTAEVHPQPKHKKSPFHVPTVLKIPTALLALLVLVACGLFLLVAALLYIGVKIAPAIAMTAKYMEAMNTSITTMHTEFELMKADFSLAVTLMQEMNPPLQDTRGYINETVGILGQTNKHLEMASYLTTLTALNTEYLIWNVYGMCIEAHFGDRSKCWNITEDIPHSNVPDNELNGLHTHAVSLTDLEEADTAADREASTTPAVFDTGINKESATYKPPSTGEAKLMDAKPRTALSKAEREATIGEMTRKMKDIRGKLQQRLDGTIERHSQTWD